MVVSEVKQAVWGLSVTAGQGAARLGKQLAVFLIALLVHVSAFGQQNTQTFTFQGNTFQDYTAPATGWYFLDARGAQGGPASNYSHQGGWGARMQGYIHLQAGDTLTIAVGGAGQVGQNIGNNVSGGGGGGGSSVLKGASPLLFAGGGGGAGAAADGLPGLNTVNGGSAAGAGGTGGSGGGIGASKYGGAGGGGYDGGGGTHLDGSSPPILSQGGSAYVSGNDGGESASQSGYGWGGFGGWGGGGQGGPARNKLTSNHDGGGGGGGGYSGGGGGDADPGVGGGGGGSFVSSELNTTGCLALSGENIGDGVVTVEHLVFTDTQPVDQTFGFQGNVFQSFTAPATGYYRISALGAQGGSVNTNSGGKGAQMDGWFLLRAGENLRIAAGGAGQDGQYGSASYPEYWTGGGGGGASSVILPDSAAFTPLLIAGGGGGAAIDGNGYDASLSGSGTTTPDGGAGGISGYGGGQGYQAAAGGAGYYTDGGGSVAPDGKDTLAAGGQAYSSGNYGGAGGEEGGNGGWGGGGQGAAYNWKVQSSCTNSCPPIKLDGSGGGGGGFSGGGGGGWDNNGSYGGGGGGSYSAAACAGSNLGGANTGNGSITISGPNVAKEMVNAFGSYTWQANGITYQNAGTYYYADISNCVVRVLDLSFSGVSGCPSYDLEEADVVSCGGFTWPLTGRTFTENMTDSFRESCTIYAIELIVAPPSTALAPESPLATITSSPDQATEEFVACRNSAQTFTMSEVPYATSYIWTLPPDATGSSTGNSIDVSFDGWFDGGPICVTPANDCGDGETVCRNIAVANHPPGGRLIVTGPSAPHVSGTYSVTPIEGATGYTWSVSNDQAVIVSGQGTPIIQLEALPGFTHANLTVMASNCEGDGASITRPLSLPAVNQE